MTVIATFKVDNVPVLIGDTLISTGTPNKKPITLPGSGKSSLDVDSYIFPTSLKQKVVLINKNLTIGWAGPEIVAISFIKELRNSLPTNDLTWEQVKSTISEFIDDISDTSLGEEFSFVLLYKDDKVVVRDGYNVRVENIDGYGEIYVAGSGADALLEALTDNETTFSNKSTPDGIKAAHKVLTLLTRLWTLDITSQTNILYGFGGGYEIATIVDGHIEKIDDILLTSAAAKSGDNDSIYIGTNSRYTKFDYLGEYLIIRVIDIEVPDTIPVIATDGDTFLEAERHEKRGFIIPPADKNIQVVMNEKIEIDKLPDFNATYIGVNLQVLANNNAQLSSCFTYWKPKRNGPIIFNEQGFYWKPELFNEIKKHAHEFLQSNTNT